MHLLPLIIPHLIRIQCILGQPEFLIGERFRMLQWHVIPEFFEGGVSQVVALNETPVREFDCEGIDGGVEEGEEWTTVDVSRDLVQENDYGEGFLRGGC